MAIEDLAGNPVLPGTTSQVIGYNFVPPPEVLPLDMYRFLIQPIREEDQRSGNKFVQRFLQGAQQEWVNTQVKIFGLKDLWDVTLCPDDLLQYLKNTVGWTKEPITDRVTRNLDALTLRRLIAASASLWKTRGPEDTIINILQLVTAARVRVWNWFDFRWVLDETVLAEEHQGRDPFIIDLPGPPNTDEYRLNVRIVDDGTLDRELVRNVVKLMRPIGERFEISYLDFLDQFKTASDDLQWERVPSGAFIPVADGVMTLADAAAELIQTAAERSASWADYSVYARFQISDAGGFLVYRDSDNDHDYRVRFDVPGDTVELEKVVAGTPTTLAAFDFTGIGEALSADEFYGVRVTITPEGVGGVRVKVYINADERLNVLDAAPSTTAGRIGFFHDAGSTLVVDEVELFQHPLVTEEVGLNPG